jgi:hypothetical protein
MGVGRDEQGVPLYALRVKNRIRHFSSKSRPAGGFNKTARSTPPETCRLQELW